MVSRARTDATAASRRSNSATRPRRRRHHCTSASVYEYDCRRWTQGEYASRNAAWCTHPNRHTAEPHEHRNSPRPPTHHRLERTRTDFNVAASVRLLPSCKMPPRPLRVYHPTHSQRDTTPTARPPSTVSPGLPSERQAVVAVARMSQVLVPPCVVPLACLLCTGMGHGRDWTGQPPFQHAQPDTPAHQRTCSVS